MRNLSIRLDGLRSELKVLDDMISAPDVLADVTNAYGKELEMEYTYTLSTLRRIVLYHSDCDCVYSEE